MSRLIDLMHLGRDRVIGAWEDDGIVIDPGPSTCVETLLADVRPRVLLLTHIHLDHAGATGGLVQRYPDIQVYVHERGAPHLIDPSRLLESATQLYGDDMALLWGEVLPVPAGNVHALSGGETVEGYRVAYTPGHASHHVAYLEESSGDAYVGDVGGVRVPPSALTVAPTPPPDIDVELWEESLDRIAEWSPERVCLTHFGAYDDVEGQFARVRESLESLTARVRELEEDEFVASHRADLLERNGDDVAERLIQAAPPDQLYLGIERYLRKRAEREAGVG